MIFRTDTHNNPAAFTTEVAKLGGLTLGVDYAQGDPFDLGRHFTARLLGDPIAITLRLIDKIGFYTARGAPRWNYATGPVGIPAPIWRTFSPAQRKATVAFLYSQEGGTVMKGLFA